MQISKIMKNTKQDSAAALSRFGRDKRTRTSTATAERNPRPRREADNEGYAARGGRRDLVPQSVHRLTPIFRRTIV